jgi:methylenetetrahydrofolate reductase (NADPH)
MRIGDLLSKKETTISFEVFPPKADSSFEPVLKAVDELSALTGLYKSLHTSGRAGNSKHCSGTYNIQMN